jgi:uncharacterized membrane-anchored protein YjiN (DUF445 family)
MSMIMKKEAKYIATVSLGVMGAGFLATLPLQGSTVGNLLQGGFEAGVVGGLADWFAVSALFRHPLGIPIPHTALLPKNREKITRALVSTVENELLSKETILARLQQIRFLDKALEVADQQLQSEPVLRGLTALCKQAVQSIDTARLAPWLQEEIVQALRAADSRAIVSGILEGAVSGGYDAKAFDFILDKVDAWAVKTETRDQLGAMALKAFEGLQTNGFMAFAVNAFIGMLSEDKIGSILQNFILSYTGQMRMDNHPRRESVLQYVRAELSRLPDNPKFIEEIEVWIEKLPEQFRLEEKLAAIMERFRRRALDWMEQPDFAERFIVPMCTKFLESLKGNPELLERGELWIQRQIADYLERNHGKIGQLVKENLDKLDNKTLIAMMEDKIGKDLQWIRVNGAICGFLIGLVLTAFKMLF